MLNSGFEGRGNFPLRLFIAWPQLREFLQRTRYAGVETRGRGAVSRCVEAGQQRVHLRAELGDSGRFFHAGGFIDEAREFGGEVDVVRTLRFCAIRPDCDERSQPQGR